MVSLDFKTETKGVPLPTTPCPENRSNVYPLPCSEYELSPQAHVLNPDFPACGALLEGDGNIRRCGSTQGSSVCLSYTLLPHSLLPFCHEMRPPHVFSWLCLCACSQATVDFTFKWFLLELTVPNTLINIDECKKYHKILIIQTDFEYSVLLLQVFHTFFML